MGYSIGAVARLARVTVRTLHHYDATGLLRPSERLASGYRSYSTADLERLQRILCYRQLGFPLETVKTLLNDTDTDPREHLRRQHALLTERIARLRRMAATIEQLLEAQNMGINLDPKDMLEVFGEEDPAQYQEEASENWGESETWAQSQRRVSTYTKEDWLTLRAEYAALMERFAAARAAGQPADSAAAIELAEAHRAHLERWFYDCHYALHRGLGEMYVNDPRFARNFDKIAPGLAVYVRDAIAASAARHGA